MTTGNTPAEQGLANNIINGRLTQLLLAIDRETPSDGDVDYKSLYYFLFNGIYDVIEKLIQLQCDAEEQLMSQSDKSG